MSPVSPFAGKTRAYLEFLAAVIYYFLARSVAHRAAFRLASDNWTPLVEQAILFLLLLTIFAAFGRLFDRESKPVAAQGLPLRSGWMREIGLGLTVGWGAAIACVIPLVLFGGIAIVLSTGRASWVALLVDFLFFAAATLAEEIAFRGYGFQRFLSVVGPVGATLGFAAFYALLQALLPGSSRLSIGIAALFSVVLSITYLRTRALWVSWGLNFGWKASRALLFGLAVSGISSHSSVIEGDPMGAFWLTGGGFGLDGSWVALFVLLVVIPLVYRVTRDLDFRYNAPVIVAAGLAVDLDASARSQHEAAMGPAQPSAPSLVQILPVTTSPASNLPLNDPRDEAH
jgi:membrane protease YdiL (CAAX protease family)